MNNYSGLTDKIAKELHISRYTGEKEGEWISRILYSATGRVALGSLWDKAEDDEEISVVRLKKKIEKTWDAYLDIYPEFASEYREETEHMVEEIYSLYEREGYFYHSPHKVAPCIKKEICFGAVTYMRGYTFDSNIYISGLGEFGKKTDKDEGYDGLARMFRIDHDSLEEYYFSSIESVKWKVLNEREKTEYLRTQPPFLRGYWKNEPDIDGSISLLRFGGAGNYIYYLYRYSDGVLMGEELPEWKTAGYKYRKLANSILNVREVLPPIEIKEKDKCVIVKFNYLPSRDLHDFLKLYSWPRSIYKVPCDFERVFSSDIWESIKLFVNELGYKVEELHV